METFDASRAPLAGTNLIEASAGTGKTYAITSLFVRLLLERGIDVDQILVVTFTEAAAAELRDRIRTRLRAAVLAYADLDAADPDLAQILGPRAAAGHTAADLRRLEGSIHAFDEAAISTIHGFCHRVLHDRAFETGVAFDTELIVDDGALVEESVRDFWASQLHAADLRFVRYLVDRGVGPSTLLELARLATRHGYAPIRPDRRAPGPPPSQGDYEDAYAHARRIWQASKREIIETLLQFPHFHATWRAQDAPVWGMSIDAFVRDPTPGSALDCPFFGNFLPQTLLDKTYAKAKKAGQRPPEHPFFTAWEQLAAARDAWQAHLRAREVDLRLRLAKYVRTQLPRKKAQAGVQSFDDLLARLRDALSGRGGKALATTIRTRYRAALIDEFQDTDPTQFHIFDAIYGKGQAPCFYIGDPKQAIYGFRGADVFAYLQAARDCRTRYTMTTNWRSDPALLRGVARLFSAPDAFLLAGIEFIDVAPRPDAEDALFVDGVPLPALAFDFVGRTDDNQSRGQIRSDWSDREIPPRVAADIARLLTSDTRLGGPDGRPVGAGDVAVLVRKNDQAFRMQRALRELGIPGVVYGDATVFETPEAGELSRVLAAVVEPTRGGLLRAAVTTELLGVTAHRLEQMLGAQDDTDWSDWVDRFRTWHVQWTERGFVQMFRAILEQPGVQARVLAMVDGERRMTNLLHLGELLHEAAGDEHLGPPGLLRWLADRVRSPPQVADAYKLRLERDDQAVQLVTIHRAKGLEYPIVYCPYLWDGSLLWGSEEEYLVVHDPQAGHALQIDVGHRADKVAAIALAQAERRAENLRLAYVAVTRARHRCVLTWGAFARSDNSPLGYLLHAPLKATVSDPRSVAANLKKLDDTALLEHLRQRGEGAWTVGSHDDAPACAPLPPPAVARVGDSRRPTRTIDRTQRVSSFSALASAGSRHTIPDEGRDHDERVATAAGPGPASAPSAPIRLATFPRGARAGNFFHDVLEHVDFAASPAAIEPVVTAKLRAHGMATDPWARMATAAVADVLDTPLTDDPTLRLRSVGAARRCSELEFILPVARTADPGLALTRERLASAFADHPAGLPAGYAARLASLGFSALRGFLKGFIDLVFEHDGRWYVVDYKTNFLGETADDYAPAHLDVAMAEDHYVLQSHLYALALVRHLRRQQPGFDYERHFGGIAYLFLRGMSPASGPSRGVYFHRPPAARIDALSARLEGRR
jgi:exodeoxyribonuclease V beta subunit